MSEPSIAFIESSMHLNMALSLMLLQKKNLYIVHSYCMNLILIHLHLSVVKCYDHYQESAFEVELRLQDRKEKL